MSNFEGESLVEAGGFEPTTPCLQSRCSDENTGSLNPADRTEAHDGAQPKDAEETQALRARIKELERALDQCIGIHADMDTSLSPCEGDDSNIPVRGGVNAQLDECVCVAYDVDSFRCRAPELSAYLRSTESKGGHDA